MLERGFQFKFQRKIGGRQVNLWNIPITISELHAQQIIFDKTLGNKF